MKRADPQAVFDRLDALAIPYRWTQHPPAFTMEDLPPIEAELGAAFCKNLFLCNRQQTEFFLLLIDGGKRFRTAEVSKKLGRARLSFGGEAALYQLLGVKPGAVTPLGLIHDLDKKINLVIDRDVLGMAQVCMHPCANDHSLVMATRDLLEVFIPHCGYTPTVVDITGEIE